MFPFNWDPQRVGTLVKVYTRHEHLSRFHSIGIPSEWGPVESPEPVKATKGFHSIGIPSEWGHVTQTQPLTYRALFPFNWDPQRVGT